MATVTGLTADRMLAMEAATVVDGEVVGGELHLIKKSGEVINAGSVAGVPGPPGPSADTGLKTEQAMALRAFHVALKNAATTGVDVLVGPGDSIVEGATLSGNYLTGWPLIYPRVLQSRLRRAMQPDGVDGGEGYTSAAPGVYLTAGLFAVGGSGTNTVRNDYGLGRRSLTVPAGNYLDIRPPVGNTSVSILVTKLPGAGSISYTVNGGAATVVDCSAGAATHAKIDISNLPVDKANVIIATIQGADVVVEGIMLYRQDETKGIRVWEAGHSGYMAADYDSNQLWANSLASLANLKLVVLSVGRNDQFYGRTPAQLKTSLQNLIALIRSKVSTDPSIVLVQYFPQNLDPPGSASPWADYKAKYKEIADADPKVTVVDLEPLFGPDPEVSNDSRGGLLSTSDYIHPSAAGYEVIGDYIADFVLPTGRTANGWETPSTGLKTLVNSTAGEGGDFLALGNFSGTLNFLTLPLQSFSLTATGNISCAAGFMPAVQAGKTASFLLRITQDATGGRTFTTNFLAANHIGGYPFIDPKPNAVTLIKCLWDGAAWWFISMNKTASRRNPVNVIASGLPNSLSFVAFDASIDTGWRLTLQQNTILDAGQMPRVTAGNEYRVRMVFIQDATGSRTLTLNAFREANGTPPVLSTAANAQDLIEFWYDGASWWVTNFVKGGA